MQEHPNDVVQRLVRDLGAEMLVAPRQWDADDLIGATTHALDAAAARQERQAADRGGVPSSSASFTVAIASADQDMLQLLTPRVRLVKLLQRVSTAAPLGLELVTAADVEAKYGLPPARYADLRAIAGKKNDKQVEGCGTGERLAATLLQRFGDLEGVLHAADAGRLKGFANQAQERLEDPATQARARHNLQVRARRWPSGGGVSKGEGLLTPVRNPTSAPQLTTLHWRATESVLPPAFAASLAAFELPPDRDAARHAKSEGKSSALHLAVSGALGALGVAHANEHVTEGRFAVDIALPERRWAIEVHGPTHYVAGTRRLNRGTLRRARLLRRAGWFLRSVPYFEWQALAEGAGPEAGVEAEEAQRAYMRAVVASLQVEAQLHARALAALEAEGTPAAPHHTAAAKRQLVLGNARYLERVGRFLEATEGVGAGAALEHVHRTALALALHTVSAPWILWNLRSPAAANAEEEEG